MVTIPCPAAMALYNRYMGGVDKNDQTQQYYNMRLKSCKFYCFIFWFLFEVAAANSHILHKHYSAVAKQQPLNEFQLKLAKGLMGKYYSKKHQGGCCAPSSTLPLSHFPVKFSPGKTSAWRRCWYCQYRQQPPQRRDTVWYSQECQNVCVYMCVYMCCVCVCVCVCMCVYMCCYMAVTSPHCDGAQKADTLLLIDSAQGLTPSLPPDCYGTQGLTPSLLMTVTVPRG